MNLGRILFRSWFYFRVGYGTYTAFLIGFASNIIVIYKLAVQENTIVGPYFRSLSIFTGLALLVAVPICISLGLYHMKRTGAYAADATVQLEANPYIYKLIPGKEQEVFLPLWVATVRILAKVLDQQEKMTDQDRKELEEILSKANALLEGHYVGRPRDLGVRPAPATRGKG